MYSNALTRLDEIKAKMPFPLDTFTINIETKMDYALFPFSEQEIVEEETRQLLSKGIVDGYIEDTIDKRKLLLIQI